RPSRSPTSPQPRARRLCSQVTASNGAAKPPLPTPLSSAGEGHRPPPRAPTLAQVGGARKSRTQTGQQSRPFQHHFQARVRAIALPHEPPPSRKSAVLASHGLKRGSEAAPSNTTFNR